MSAAAETSIRSQLLSALRAAGVTDPAQWLAEHSAAALLRKLETAEARAEGREPDWQRGMRGAER